MKKFRKTVRRVLKRATNKEFLTKVVIVVSSLALLSSVVLPFIIR